MAGAAVVTAGDLPESWQDLRPLGIVGVTDVKEDVVRLYLQGPDRGVSTGWQNIDDLFRVRPGELTVITGTPGSGKSNFLDAMLINMAHNTGFRTAIFSPEQLPISEHIARLCEKLIRKPFDLNYKYRLDAEELFEAMHRIEGWFEWIDPTSADSVATIDSILELAYQITRRKRVNGLVIDPWNELEHIERLQHRGLSESEYIGRALSELRLFARSTKIHVFVVAHPTKLSLNDKGQFPVPTYYDVAGSANWANKPDNVITVWRDLTAADTPQVDIHLKKVRFRATGRRGITSLYFNREQGTYTQYP